VTAPTRAARLMSALAALAVFAAAFSPLRAAPRPARSEGRARTVTGSYYGPSKAGLDVLELPGGRIKFYLVALGRLSDPGGPTTGEAYGVVPLRGGVAIYQYHGDPDRSDGSKDVAGKLVMRFQGGRVFVSEQDDLGFGQGVRAGGIYVRHSRKRPVFDRDGRSN